MYRFFSIFIFLLSLQSQAGEVLLRTTDKTIPFDSLRGKWVLISYWATWCPPCLDEIEVLNQFYRAQLKDKTILFSVNYDGLSPEEQIKMAKTYKLEYPTLIEDPAQSLKLGEIRNLPAIFIFNPAGELQAQHYGEQTLASLNRYLSKIKRDFEQAQPSTQHVYKPSA
jgi:thiol-disulfide isomerase/thioredoxin